MEKWNPHAKVRHDLFGFIDIVAVADDIVLAVQATSDSNVAARVRKIEESENVAAVRRAGIQIHVHGWKKVKGKWRVRTIDVS